MTFTDALEYIHSLLKFGIQPGLSRMDTLLQILGNPQNDFKCIHIAGTNGKGSTSTAISNVLIEAGYNVGLYTSPYVTEFLERVQHNGKPIDKKLFTDGVEAVKPHIEKMAEENMQITEFEALTAVAFWCFSKLELDVVVLEVGLGGRLDATNVIPTPLVNVITSLSLDHTAILGDSIEQIAAEKCGTIKENGTIVVSMKQPEAALKVIKEKAKEKNNSLIIPCENDVEIISSDVFATKFIYKNNEYVVNMAGEHQVLNMVNIIEATNVLNNKGFLITDENLKLGIKNTFLPARVEVVSKKPLVILDGGHNEDGAKAFFEAVKEELTKKRVFVVAGMMNDKAVEDSLKPLASNCFKFIAVTPDNPRAMSACDLEKIAKKYCSNTLAIENPISAINQVRHEITESDALFVVGSLYLAGEVRATLIDVFKNC